MTREERRNKAAEKVCREVTYQMSYYGRITDNLKLFKYISIWFNVAKKNRYVRPEVKIT